MKLWIIYMKCLLLSKKYIKTSLLLMIFYINQSKPLLSSSLEAELCFRLTLCR